MSAPAQITFQATCKPQTMTLSVSVAGADAVEFTYTSPDGTIAATVMRTGGGAPCATWNAAFAQAFDRKGTVTVVPLFGTTRGTSRTVTVDIASGSTAFSAVTFTGTTPPPGRPSATIERRDVPCDGSGPFVTTTVGTIASGGTATFTLTRGTLSMFTVTWPARETGGNDDVSGASTTTSEFLGHPDAPTLATDV
jgi:hypothetical protein